MWRTVGLVIFVLSCAGVAVAQSAFPKRPLPPERALNLKWFKNEKFMMGKSILEGDFRYRQGRTDDGFVYTIYSNGNGGIDGYGEVWSVHCQVDAMTDQQNCNIASLTNTAIFLYFGASDYPTAACVIGHDFPGRQGAIRVENHPARATDGQGCVDSSIVTELTSSMQVRTRAVKWPNDFPVDRQGTLAGLNQAIALVRYIRANLGKMNF
jgi:hypothetical protein